MNNDKDEDEKLLDVVPVVILNNRINQLLTKIDDLEKLLNFTMALLVAGSDNRGETNQNDPEEKPKPE